MEPKNNIKIIAEEGKQELFIIREFDAPRELVYKAFSSPDILVTFFAPENATMKFETPDYTSGRPYRYSHFDKNGNLLCSFKGVVHEMAVPERIVQTSELDGSPEGGHAVLETIQFESLANNRTKLTIHDVCRFVADRNAMIASGMEYGLREIFDNLDVLLKQNEDFL